MRDVRGAARGAAGVVAAMAAPRVLWAAWSRVAAGSGMAGADGITTAGFGRDVGARLAALGRLLRDGEYRPQPLRPMSTVRNGRRRSRGLPTVCDRVVQRAFLESAAPMLRVSGATSFSYQRGRSWLDAVAAARRYAGSGLGWVLRTDVADFFASVDHGLLRRELATRLTDEAALRLVTGWVAAPVLTATGRRPRHRGLPEGAPISPALAEVFLAGVDRQVDHKSGRLVRFADDITVFCTSRDRALDALSEVRRALEQRGLAVNWATTSIADLDHGFDLLGWSFSAAGAAPAGQAGTSWR